MAEKPRELSPEERLWAAKEYLSGKDSTYSIYNVGGDAALLQNHTKKLYSKSFKLDVLQAQLAGQGSYSEPCAHYNIPSFDTVRIYYLKTVHSYEDTA